MSDEMDVLFDHRLRSALHSASLPPAPASLHGALDDLPRTARAPRRSTAPPGRLGGSGGRHRRRRLRGLGRHLRPGRAGARRGGDADAHRVAFAGTLADAGGIVVHVGRLSRRPAPRPSRGWDDRGRAGHRRRLLQRSAPLAGAVSVTQPRGARARLLRPSAGHQRHGGADRCHRRRSLRAHWSAGRPPVLAVDVDLGSRGRAALRPDRAGGRRIRAPDLRDRRRSLRRPARG